MDQDLDWEENTRHPKDTVLVWKKWSAGRVGPELESITLNSDLDRRIWPRFILQVDGHGLRIEALDCEVVLSDEGACGDEARVSTERQSRG